MKGVSPPHITYLLPFTRSLASWIGDCADAWKSTQIIASSLDIMFARPKISLDANLLLFPLCLFGVSRKQCFLFWIMDIPKSLISDWTLVSSTTQRYFIEFSPSIDSAQVSFWVQSSLLHYVRSVHRRWWDGISAAKLFPEPPSP